MEENGERRPIHGWGDHRKFLVGSFHDIDGKSRISSTSISFFAASSLYDKEYDKDILSAIDRLDSKYGLRTFDVGFDPDLKGIGRIGKLPLGTAENAAVYIHAGMFAVHSLFKIGPFTNKKLNLSALASVVLVLLVLFVPGLNAAFDLVILEWWKYLIGLGLVLVPLVVMEISKLFGLIKPHHHK
jgi:hypothetical protein